MAVAMAVLGSLIVGFALWTITEYVLHRFGMHEMKGKGLASREHLNHHSDRDSLLEKWALSWTGTLLVGFGGFGFLGSLVTGSSWTYVVGAGFVGTFFTYELIHWRAHRRPPTGPYSEWVRRHHFFHHFGHPMQNHGVTTPIWDIVFGTYVRPEVVRVPRRMAMVWLVDENGDMHDEYVGRYEVVGARRLTDEQRLADKQDAFANLAPAV